MELREYCPLDCPELARLFYQTVHSVNAADYTGRQLDAWADGNVDLREWDRTLSAHHTFVCVMGQTVVGFGDIDDSGYLDRLYVHRDAQRKGVASALCGALEQAVAADRIVTHASVTARPFFEKRGYAVVREQQVIKAGVPLTNFVMEKRLAPAPDRP